MFSLWQFAKQLLSIFLLSLIVVQQSWSLSDPTQPSSYRSQAIAEGSLKLESILVSDSRRVAVINGKAVVEGDTIGDSKVTMINKQKVLLDKAGKTIELTLHRASVRRK